MFLTSLRCKYSPQHHVVKCVPLLRPSLTTTNNKRETVHPNGLQPDEHKSVFLYSHLSMVVQLATKVTHLLINLHFSSSTSVFMSYPFHPPWFNYCNNNWWKIQIISSTLHNVFIYYNFLCLPSTCFIICPQIYQICDLPLDRKTKFNVWPK
jgi:hypothetical protein